MQEQFAGRTGGRELKGKGWAEWKSILLWFMQLALARSYSVPTWTRTHVGSQAIQWGELTPLFVELQHFSALMSEA